jgi:Fe-S-cluster containining protein
MLQINKPEDCWNCTDRCCRFAPHLLRFSPIFTKEEFELVVRSGFSRRLFMKRGENIYQLKLSKREGKFFVCPFLANDGCWCSIYKIAPHDCKLWPFVVMRGKGKNKNRIYLMVDKANECPILKKSSKEKKKKYIRYLKKYLEGERTIRLFKKYPEMISDYDCDLTRVCYMKNLTKKLGGV